MTILRYVFLGLALLIAAGIGWRSAGGLRLVTTAHNLPPVVQTPARSPKPAAVSPPAATIPPVTPTLAQTRAATLKNLDEVPQFSAFYKELEKAFPHVYADFVDHAARARLAGDARPSASGLIWEALRDLQQADGILAAGAGADALAMFFDARLSMLDLLATVDQRTCADFLYGTADPSIEGFSIAHRDLVGDMAAKQLAAIEDGQIRHLDPAAPSPEDLDLVAVGLTGKNVNPDEIAMLLDGKAIDPPLPDARLCDLGRTYLSVLKALPAAARQRIYGFTAELLARS